MKVIKWLIIAVLVGGVLFSILAAVRAVVNSDIYQSLSGVIDAIAGMADKIKHLLGNG